MGRYAFYFDSSGCSGCKACQVACKDRNGLEVGLLWRRVYEVSGGSWEKRGDAWQQDVYAYNLSVACNHCEKAICAEACPTGAITQREDGIVLIEAQRCIACRYCSWACPYGAPQYDPRTRSMTKCTMCVEDVDAGLAPACVAACPLRVLDFGEQAELEDRGALRTVAPLPEAEMTRPAMFIQPHRDAGRQGGQIANREEVQTGKKSSELPLVIFTVLVQMAVGAFIVLGAVTYWLASQVGGLDNARIFTLSPLLATGVVFAIGVMASLLHLGRPLKAYRALSNLRISWLSREILLVGFFGAGWAVFCGILYVLPTFTHLLWIIYGLSTFAGLTLISCMARVYHLNSMPAWQSWMTPVSFYMTAGLLGVLLSEAQLIHIALSLFPTLRMLHPELYNVITSGTIVGLLCLVADLALQGRQETSVTKSFWSTQLHLTLTVAALLPLALVLAQFSYDWMPLQFALAFLLALGAQVISRWQFYKRLDEREM